MISSTELSVSIPAALLMHVGTVRVLVENGDPMGVSDGYDGYPKSTPVNFEITAPVATR